MRSTQKEEFYMSDKREVEELKSRIQRLEARQTEKREWFR